jgi:hypothetical protein
MLIGVAFFFCTVPIQGALLLAAGIFVLLGIILRELPAVGSVASAPFFAARRVLEHVMLLGLSLTALVIIPTVLIPGEFLFKGECTVAGYVFNSVVLHPKRFFSDLGV